VLFESPVVVVSAGLQLAPFPPPVNTPTAAVDGAGVGAKGAALAVPAPRDRVVAKATAEPVARLSARFTSVLPSWTWARPHPADTQPPFRDPGQRCCTSVIKR
jgi:hypothetical protein